MGPKAQTQRCNRTRREPRTLTQPPRCMTQVSPEVLNNAKRPLVPQVFLHQLRIPKRPPRALRHPRPPVLLLPHRQMKRQFVFQIAFQLPPFPQRSPSEAQIRDYLPHAMPPSAAPPRCSTVPIRTIPRPTASVPPPSAGSTSRACGSLTHAIRLPTSPVAPAGE